MIKKGFILLATQTPLYEAYNAYNAILKGGLGGFNFVLKTPTFLIGYPL